MEFQFIHDGTVVTIPEITSEYAREHLTAKLVPETMHTPVMEDVGGGLNLVYCLDLSPFGYGEVPLTTQALYKLFPEQHVGMLSLFLHETALSNLKKKKTMLLPLEDVFLAGADIKDLPEKWIVSDHPGCLGVYVFMAKNFDSPALLLDADIDERIRSLTPFKDGYYVIPSSIHEVLLVPKASNLDPKLLLEVNHEVNAQEVSPKDFLGEHIYEVTDCGFEIVA